MVFINFYFFSSFFFFNFIFQNQTQVPFIIIFSCNKGKLAAQFTRFGKTKVNGICIMNHLLLLSNGIDVSGKEGPRQVIMLPNCTTPTTGAIALYLSLLLLGIKLSIVLVKKLLYTCTTSTQNHTFSFLGYPKSIFINILEFNFQCLFQSSQTLGFVYISVHV